MCGVLVRRIFTPLPLFFEHGLDGIFYLFQMGTDDAMPDYALAVDNQSRGKRPDAADAFQDLSIRGDNRKWNSMLKIGRAHV